MKKIIEVRVPDIGDSKAVPVVEVLAAVGDRLSLDDIILVLESDKATLEVPIGAEGRVLELLVAVGDEISEGSLIAKVGSISAHPESIEPSASGVTTPAIAALTEEVMTSLFDICVPDIGDSQQAPVVEIPINVGDILSADDVVAILESDKAAMEVPAETEGRVVEILIKVGDEVGEGCSIARVEPTAAQVDIPVTSVAQPPAPAAHSEVYVRHQTQLPSQGQPVYASPSIRRFARSLYRAGGRNGF
nr:biotin/lipoyl-containing protein [uncultured Amphritea sp.]